jgi:sporulation protein YlmC with PRC-barrel domain
MKMKSIAAGLLGSALLATTALAQTPAAPATTTTTSATTENTSNAFNGNWRTSKVVGLNVYNDQNESLGSINDLLTDKNGKIVAVIVGVGGFLGVGERNVAIPFEKVKFSTDPVKSNMASGGAMPGSTTTTTSTTTTGSAMSTPAAVKANPWYPDHATISATKDELKSMPEFKFST